MKYGSHPKIQQKKKKKKKKRLFFFVVGKERVVISIVYGEREGSIEFLGTGANKEVLIWF